MMVYALHLLRLIEYLSPYFSGNDMFTIEASQSCVLPAQGRIVTAFLAWSQCGAANVTECQRGRGIYCWLYQYF